MQHYSPIPSAKDTLFHGRRQPHAHRARHPTSGHALADDSHACCGPISSQIVPRRLQRRTSRAARVTRIGWGGNTTREGPGLGGIPRRAPQAGHSTWTPGVSRSCAGVRSIAPAKGHCGFLAAAEGGGASPTRSRSGARSPTRRRFGGAASIGDAMLAEALGCEANPLIPSKLHKCSRLLSV